MNRDLVTPYALFNFGPQTSYPRLKIKYVESEDVELIVSSVEKLVPLGLRVKSQEINSLLGLSMPEEDDEILAPPSPAQPQAMNSERSTHIALNASEVTADEIEEEELPEGYTRISDDIAAVIEKAEDGVTDFKSFRAELEKLVTDWTPDKIAELMALEFFKARADGADDFEAEG